MTFQSRTNFTKPHAGQKPGTSGLRKKVKEFMQENYTENFVQCIFDALGEQINESTLVVGGDGRYFINEAINIIISMAAANGISKLIIGQNGLLSTPAVSNLIRTHKLLGGILLTASHNPGGLNNDFGIKYNAENGGPASDVLTNKIYELTQSITEYKIVPNLKFNISQVGKLHFQVDGREFIIDIVDSTEDYVTFMKDIFDFDKVKCLIKGSELQGPFKILIDSMNAVTGPYVKRIFLDELGAAEHCVKNIVPSPDFGGLHPDPNLTYAKHLVLALTQDISYDFGAAFDGDGDRNMILGKNAFFVTPSDSLAVIANNLECIPFFQRNGITGFARSMPTAAAVDRVAAKLGKEIFEVPTGWKYFGNLMDADRLCLCGEESFGTGSNHVREKDGIWAALAWLSIIQHKNMSVEDILKEHWAQYGRNYFTRYDYEECDTNRANEMMDLLENSISDNALIGKTFISRGKSYKMKLMDNFSYVDPIDKSLTTKQGVRIIFEDGSRLVFRMSGTGSSGATIRMYVDSYEKENYQMDTRDALRPLINIALKISKLEELTGRNAPTVIT